MALVANTLARWLKIPETEHRVALGVSVVASSFAFGLFLAAGAVFLLRSIRLHPESVGLVFAIGNGTAFVGSIFFGSFVDRFGSGRAVLLAAFVNGLGLTLVGLVDDTLSAAIVFSIVLSASILERVGLSAVVADIYSGSSRVSMSAFFRSLTNLGFALGAGVAAVVVTAGTRLSYGVMFAAAGLVQFSVLGMRLWLRGVSGSHMPEAAKRLVALRDVPYVAVAGVFGAATVGNVAISLLVPVWVTRNDSVPSAIAPAALLLNTLLIIVLQARFAAGARSGAQSAGGLRRGCLWAAAGFLVLATSDGSDTRVVIVEVLGAVGLLTLSELRCSVAGWACRFDFARPGRQGEYGALFGMGELGAAWLAPGPLTTSIQALGTGAWLMLAGFFSALTLVGPVAISWCAGPRQAST
jgi:MFS family permease